jgi:hypothetical protein
MKVKLLWLFVVMRNKHSSYSVFNPDPHVWSVTRDNALKYWHVLLNYMAVLTINKFDFIHSGPSH